MEIRQYLKFRRSYERFVRQLLLDFQFFTEDSPGINIYSVEHRLRSFESAHEKALRLHIPITDLHDIAGMRIVVATAKEIDVVARFFYRKADSKDLVVESDRKIEKDDGYRARHLLLKVGGHYSRSVHQAMLEVQLQTVMEHAYNYISRSWIYKAERSLSDQWHNDFLEVSRILTDLDLKITKLQTEILDSAVSGKDNEPLTAFSYQRIVGELFGEQVSIDDAVDAVQMLIDLQCDTNSFLKRFFSQARVLGHSNCAAREQ
jgi:ppGpp synthetase/RelA/SpoT-type nucleotidyltranferase